MVLVFATSVTPELKLLTVEYCHLLMVPVWPLRVRVVELVPVQIEVPPEILPPTAAALMVMAPETLLVAAGVQVPLTLQ